MSEQNYNILGFGCNTKPFQNFETPQPNIFSFSLFITKKYSDIYTAGQDITEWYIKYPVKQCEKINMLLTNSQWDDFGIVVFLDSNLRNININYDGIIMSIPDFYRYRLNNPRVSIHLYSCTQLQNESGIHKEYYGSLVRYLPLILPEYNTVLFRDAHSTMPNPYTTYDREWYNTWLQTPNKYWIYNMINYNPPHSLYEKVLFAGAWGARKSANDTTIFSPELWNTVFSGLLQIFDNEGRTTGYFSKEEYGVDERMLLYFIDTKEFKTRSYIVGMTELVSVYLGSEINPRIGQRFKNSGAQQWNLTTRDLDFLEPQSSGVQSYNGVQTYFGELSCVLKILNNILNNPPLGTLLSFIEQNASETDSSDVLTVLSKRLLYLMPNRYHLWSFLFDQEHNPNEITLNNYIIATGGRDSIIDRENKCSIIPKYLRGNSFNFDKYQYKINNIHEELPENIRLPENYPNNSIITSDIVDEEADMI